MKNIIAIACIAMTLNCWVMAQGTNATLSGVVTDQTGAAIPGATVTAQNTKTGVTSKLVSNEAGVYRFVSLQPGVYRVTAERTGFRTSVYDEVLLEITAQINLNIKLEIGQAAEVIEIKASDRADLGSASTSAGGVINGGMVTELPLPDREAIALVATIAGVFGDNVNGSREGAIYITRDGINIQDSRQNTGISSQIFNSVDLIQEVRVVTSPADAEYGRGIGQIQLITRSGSNEFHGSVFEQHRNRSFNANTWFDNLNGREVSTPVRNQFGARLGGPIKKNKTFFHVVYEGQRQYDKDQVNSTVLTETARQGIFRFFPGANNGNANSGTPTVDVNGNPVRPANATGPLQSVNLFGRDPNRMAPDRTGIIANYLKDTPLPNNFRSGDGLNTAAFTWTRTTTNNFNNVTVKIDHNFNESHKAAYTYTRDNRINPNGFLAAAFPDYTGGLIDFRNRLHSMSLTSTLRANLVNEFRAGAYRPFDIRFDGIHREGAEKFLPTAGGQRFALDVGAVGLGLTNPFNLGDAFHGRTNPIYQYSDSLSWIRGRHSFKGGVEVRFISSNGFNSVGVFPDANFGAGGASVRNINNTAIPGLGGNTNNAQRLLNLLSGSLSSVSQVFHSPGGVDPQFVPYEVKQRTWKQRQFNIFFKDDFQVKPNLTLNLGVRYEFYGVPFEANGKTTALVGGAAGIFGISGESFAAMYQPGRSGGSLTRIEQVGKHSPNPDRKLYNNDWNNFAPAVGLARGIPWFGKEKTTLRIGFGMGFERNSIRLVDVISGDQPRLSTTVTFTNSGYLDLTGISIPLTTQLKPFETVPLTQRTQIVRGFDHNFRTPYYQNWNVSVQRDLGWNTTFEVRYVGSKGTKLPRAIDVNEVNIFETGILDAFLVTQAGGHSPLLNQIFKGLNVSGLGVIDGTKITGSDLVRFNSTTLDWLNNNQVGSFANWLNTTNDFTGQNGGLLRRAGLPENFIVVNPQFSSARLLSNSANSTYHAMQVEVSKRFSNGLQFRSNYAWSRALGEHNGDSGGDGQELFDAYRDSRNRRMDKRLLSYHRTHIFRNSGVFQLPFGPGKPLLRSGTGTTPTPTSTVATSAGSPAIPPAITLEREASSSRADLIFESKQR